MVEFSTLKVSGKKVQPQQNSTVFPHQKICLLLTQGERERDITSTNHILTANTTITVCRGVGEGCRMQAVLILALGFKNEKKTKKKQLQSGTQR